MLVLVRRPFVSDLVQRSAEKWYKIDRRVAGRAHTMGAAEVPLSFHPNALPVMVFAKDHSPIENGIAH